MRFVRMRWRLYYPLTLGKPSLVPELKGDDVIQVTRATFVLVIEKEVSYET